MRKPVSKKILLTAVLLFLSGSAWHYNHERLVAKDTSGSSSKKKQPKTTKDGYLVLDWFDLLPEGYDPDTLYAKYADRINSITDEDAGARELIEQLRHDLDNTPLNTTLHEKKIKMPGFVAGLENSGNEITEFLLVPYFGACIHSPPPPQNQTVLVKVRKGKGIPQEKSFSPFWIKGTILIQSQNTGMGKAGYTIVDAEAEPYTGNMPEYK